MTPNWTNELAELSKVGSVYRRRIQGMFLREDAIEVMSLIRREYGHQTRNAISECTFERLDMLRRGVRGLWQGGEECVWSRS
jgi:hypothetical protein